MSRKRMLWGICVSAVLAVLLSAAVSAKKPPKPPPDPGNPAIAYVQGNRSGQGEELKVMDADGSNSVTILSSNDDLARPSWSPDGTRLAFWGTMQGSGIYTVNLDGTGLTKIASTSIRHCDVAWSPAESGENLDRIAFEDRVSPSPDYWDICFVYADGTGRETLTLGATDYQVPNGNFWEVWPTWSPTGDRLVYEARYWLKENESHYGVFLYDFASDGVTWLTRPHEVGSGDGRSPDWARTGERIALIGSGADGTGAKGIWILDITDPSNPIWTAAAAENGIDERTPSWSPDDSRIVYWRAVEGNGGMLNKKAMWVLTETGGEWNPPGTQIARKGSKPAWRRDS